MSAEVAPSTRRAFDGFRTYAWRWLLFGFLAGVATPVATGDGDYGFVKAIQIANGLFFGLVCAVVFTLLQNRLNAGRSRGRSWAILIGTWMGVKFLFVGIQLAAFGSYERL